MQRWNMLGMILLMLIGTLFGSLTVRAQDEPGPTALPLVIETVNVEIRLTDPPQVSLYVIGYQQDLCEFPVMVAQERTGTHITVTIYRDVPPNVRCIGGERPYEGTITLEGDFEAGITYTVAVNNQAVRFDPGSGVIPEDTTVNNYYRAETVIESVTVEVLPTDPTRLALHVTGYHPDGCDFPAWIRQARDGNLITIDIYLEIPIVVDCSATYVPYEETIILTQPLSPGSYVVQVNDYLLGLEIQTDSTIEVMEVVRFNVDVTDVQALIMESFPMQLSLQVSGQRTTGCDVPVYVRQHISATTIEIEIFSVMSPAMACPRIILPYEETIRIDGAFTGGRFTVQVNDHISRVDFGSPPPVVTPLPPPPTPDGTFRAYAQIESVIVGRHPTFAPYPAALFITVSGYHGDGCSFPTIVEQRMVGNTVFVEIFREMPIGIACPAVITPFTLQIDLQGTFNAGRYRIDVNGLVVEVDV